MKDLLYYRQGVLRLHAESPESCEKTQIMYILMFNYHMSIQLGLFTLSPVFSPKWLQGFWCGKDRAVTTLCGACV